MWQILTKISDIINNSKFLTVVMMILTVILFISLIVYIIRLLSNIRAYIVNKSNSFYLSNQKKTNTDTASLNMTDRIDATNAVLDLISFMVTNEIASHFKSYISLKVAYDLSKLDVDASTISTTVFNGINKDLFKDPNLLLTEKYLMEFITKKTITVMIEASQNHNNNIRSINQSNGE